MNICAASCWCSNVLAKCGAHQRLCHARAYNIYSYYESMHSSRFLEYLQYVVHRIPTPKLYYDAWKCVVDVCECACVGEYVAICPIAEFTYRVLARNCEELSSFGIRESNKRTNKCSNCLGDEWHNIPGLVRLSVCVCVCVGVWMVFACVDRRACLKINCSKSVIVDEEQTDGRTV